MGTYAKYICDKIPDGILNLPNADVIVLPPEILVEGTYDEELNEITPPEVSSKICIDIFWYDKPENIGIERVYPNKTNHSIIGMEEKYIKDSLNAYLE